MNENQTKPREGIIGRRNSGGKETGEVAPTTPSEGRPIENGVASFLEDMLRSYHQSWERRVSSDYFAEVIGGDGMTRYHVLGVLGELYILAEDIAHSTGREVLEVLKLAGHGDEIYFPERGLPPPIPNAVPGLYVPFDMGIGLIPEFGKWYLDVYELASYRDEFNRRVEAR